MGMDYQYAGSASYPRFDEEVKKVVEILGGRETSKLEARKDDQNKKLGGLGYWFGYASSADPHMEKYIFPENTDPLLVSWFNNIYSEYSAEDTKRIMELLFPYKIQIEEASRQIWEELKYLVRYNEGWCLG